MGKPFYQIEYHNSIHNTFNVGAYYETIEDGIKALEQDATEREITYSFFLAVLVEHTFGAEVESFSPRKVVAKQVKIRTLMRDKIQVVKL